MQELLVKIYTSAWDSMVTQAMLSGVIGLSLYLAFVAFLFFFWFFIYKNYLAVNKIVSYFEYCEFNRLHKHNDNGHCITEAKEFNWWIKCIFTVIVAVTMLVGFFGLSTWLTLIFNPEYYAVTDLLELIGKMK